MRFSCPHCQHTLRARPDQAGRKLPCPSCHEPVLVPEEDDVLEEPDSGYLDAGETAIDPLAQAAEQASTRHPSRQQRAIDQVVESSEPEDEPAEQPAAVVPPPAKEPPRHYPPPEEEIPGLDDLLAAPAAPANEIPAGVPGPGSVPDDTVPDDAVPDDTVPVEPVPLMPQDDAAELRHRELLGLLRNLQTPLWMTAISVLLLLLLALWTEFRFWFYILNLSEALGP